MRSLSYENEFYLHVNKNSFSYERFRTSPLFEKEATRNSEMAYCGMTVELVLSKGQQQLGNLRNKISFPKCFRD